MNEERKLLTDILVTFGGKIIGTLEAINHTVVVERKEEEYVDLSQKNFTLMSPMGVTVDLKDVEIDPNFTGTLFSKERRLRVEAIGYKFPRGKKLPKKKRLRKKWMKKYGKKITLDNCYFV